MRLDGHFPYQTLWTLSQNYPIDERTKLQDYRNLLTHNGRLYKEHPSRELTEEQLFQAF